MVLDTNILIYSAKPGGKDLRRWLDDPGAMMSIVSRIESLGFPGINAKEKAALENAFHFLPESGLTEPVAARTIALRQERKMGLADAIIAATALVYDTPLVTRNIDDFKHVAGLRLINPFADAA